ncbi:MAG TPA: hypothetical protein VF783_14180 [Terriglobales bacterium]
MVLLGDPNQPGTSVPWIDWDVEQNTWHSAGTFRVRLPVSALKSPIDTNYVLGTNPIQAQIYAGFPGNPDSYGTADLQQLITGNVDNIQFDPVRRIIELSGRDYTSLLIDAKTFDRWTNQTASQIATTLAQRHGLTPAVTATTGAVGKIYEIDKIHDRHGSTEWELLTWLASIYDYVTYVQGTTLYFGPRASPAPPQDTTALQAQFNSVKAQLSAANNQEMTLLTQQGQYLKQNNPVASQAMQPQIDAVSAQANALVAQYDSLKAQLAQASATGVYELVWQAPQGQGSFQSNVLDMSFSRTLTVGKGVVVQVHSWNHKQKAGFTVTYPSGKAKGAQPGTAKAPAQVYTYIIANLTQQDAQERAAKIYNDIIRHELKMTAELPGDNILTPNTMVSVSGTQTPFDTMYYVESVNRRMSFDSGYTMNVRGKNHSLDTTVIPS